jgi:hypothetical protein
LSPQARKAATVGEMVNLIQVNANSFVELTAYLCTLWSAPMQIIIAVVMLWSYLGVATLAGLLTMLLVIPINGVIAKRQRTLQMEKLKLQDSRIKLSNEILNGIKVNKIKRVYFFWK